MNYNEISSKLIGKSMKKIANNTYLVRLPEDTFSVRLHQTDVVTFFEDGKIRLDSSKWGTPTTKDRINSVLPDGYRIEQEKSCWQIHTPCLTYIFKDGAVINVNSGKVTGASKQVKQFTNAMQRKLKAIRAYAKMFVEKLFAGEISKPSAGDCFFCGMKDTITGKPLGEIAKSDHIASHIKEKYFVPSLIVNACESFPISPIAKSVIVEIWQNGKSENDFLFEVAKRQVLSSLTRYIKRNLNFAD